MSSPPVPPPGTRYLPDWYIARPFEEETALGYLAYGQPVLLWGPRDQGCTWLSRHLARTWQQAGAAEGAGSAPERCYIVIDFRSLGARDLESLDACLREIAEVLGDALPEDPTREPVAERWQRMHGSPKNRLTGFVRRVVLPAMPGELLLVFDHADLVHAQPFYEDFAGLLRSWAEKGKDRQPWDRLRLLVSVSVPPARLRTAHHESPFVNLSKPIQVRDFEAAQVAKLARRHGLDWSETELRSLMALVGGHPYLVRAVLEDVRNGRYRLADLAADKDLGRSLIDEYLQRDRTRLAASPSLDEAFGQLVEDPAVEVTPAALDDLIRLGLVTQGPGGSHPVRYRLFQRLRYARDAEPGPRRRRLFYSYAHADEERRARLEVHLKLLERQGLIASWHDRRIPPGSEWRDEIDRNLEQADLILLLVSADFLASDYCWGVETKRALERHQAGEARVVPIILRSCDWHSAPFAELQALPKDALPVSRWTDEDDAWADIASTIRKFIESAMDSNEFDPVTEAVNPPAHLAQSDLDRLIRALEGCTTIKDHHARAQIIERLPSDILVRIRYLPMLRSHVTEIVLTCASIPGGLLALRQAVHHFEGDTDHMNAFDSVLASMKPKRC